MTNTLAVESEESCSYLGRMSSEPLEHDHDLTYMAMSEEVASYSCSMVLEDTPIVDTLLASEQNFLPATM